MKKWLLFIPEVVLILIAVYWFLDSFIPKGTINYIALTFVLILTLQLKFQNKIIGNTMASLILILSIYLVPAVLSEFHEFPKANNEAINLLLFGMLLCLMLFSSSFVLFYKYNKINNN